MEEKSDIQKLKDLFIEYHGEGVYGIIEPEHGIYLREAMKARAPYIISRKYGFIRWLVENDKIDLDKLPKHLQWEGVNTDIKGEELVTMVLSIQDEPINFLLEILK